MASEAESSANSFWLKSIGFGLGAIVIFGLILFALPENSNNVVDPVGPDDPDESVTDADCEVDLEAVLEGMRPGRLGISSDQENRSDDLNRWWEDCGPGPDEKALVNDADLLEELFEGETLKRVTSPRFSPSDTAHVRMSLLSRAIVDWVANRGRTDEERALLLYSFVTRHVALLPPTADIPLTPYETLLFGRGTAADRAWLFAELLRQLRIDTVVVRPQAANDSTPWLIGVIDEKRGVLLFEPEYGVPVPAPGSPLESPFPAAAATLAEAIDEAGVLKQLDLPDRPYPVTPEALANSTFDLIGHSSSWSPRMAELQFLLPLRFEVDLYNGLGENDLREPGLIERVRLSVGSALEEMPEVSVWPLPDDKIARIQSARGAEGTELAALFEVFSGPIVLRQDRSTGGFYQAAIDHTLHEVRLKQVMGEHALALKEYLPIRTAVQKLNAYLGQMTDDPNLIAYVTNVDTQAADHADFWVGVSQFEMGKIPAALGTFRRYLEQRPQGGIWSEKAIEWIALCFIAAGDPVRASEVLASVPPEARSLRSQWLIKRWTQSSVPAEESSPEPSNPPASEMPAESQDENEAPAAKPPAVPEPEPAAGSEN